MLPKNICWMYKCKGVNHENVLKVNGQFWFQATQKKKIIYPVFSASFSILSLTPFPSPPSVKSSTSSQLAGVLKLSSPFSLSVALQVTHSWPPYTSPPHTHIGTHAHTHRYHPPPKYKRVLKLGMELNPWKKKRKKKPAKWPGPSQHGTAFKEKHTHTITASGRHNITRSVRRNNLKWRVSHIRLHSFWKGSLEKSTGDLRSLWFSFSCKH